MLNRKCSNGLILIIVMMINLAASADSKSSRDDPQTQSTTSPKDGTATSSKKILIYTPHGPGMVKLVKTEFEKQYPGFEIDWLYLGAGKIFDRLKSEKSAPKADIVWGGPHYLFINAAEAGLLAPYRPSWHKSINASFHDSEHRWYGDMQTPLSITYNTQVLPKAKKVRDWDDLTDSRLLGRIIVRYPPASGTMRTIYAVLIDRQLRRGKTLKQAFQWLQKMEDNTRTYASHSQVMFHKLGQGLFWISLWNIPEVGTRKTQGYPIDYVFPKSGVPVLLDAIALVNKPQIPDHVKKFYEVATSKKMVEALAAKPHFRIPTRTDVAPETSPKYLKDPRFRVMDVNWSRVAKESDGWIGRWEKEIADPKKLKD